MKPTAQIKDGKIIEFNAIKLVKHLGNGGYVLLPKILVGKKVNISLKKK